MFRGVFATAAVVTVLAAVPASADEVPGPVDLGTLPGGLTSVGLRVTYHGTVFGEAYDAAFHQHAARWDAAGRISELRPLDGYDTVTAVAINEAGVAIGNSMATVLAGRATRWDASGVPAALPLLPGFPYHPSTEAAAINDHGVIAGFAYGAPGPDTAVRWETDGTVTELGFGRVRAMNEAGAVIGWRFDTPLYWDPAGNLVEMTGARVLADIDDAGTAVGSAGSHAAKWDSAGHLTVLDTTWAASSALAITADGTIFGEVTGKDGTTRVARWDPAGRLLVLPTPDGAPSRFTAVSPAGVVLGELDWTKSVVWTTAGELSVLPLPPVENASCHGYGLTDWEVTGSCSAPGRNSHAVLWKLGEPVGS
ncbi:hypothetical protein AB0C38_45630 [Amycolatopsis sp. NPDC048633]|uniref:hypothetical protein n=1 Tax=Amycolatopsis sp. NPDC048633 TaxID=3157095 RepID=UPI0033FB8A7F